MNAVPKKTHRWHARRRYRFGGEPRFKSPRAGYSFNQSFWRFFIFGWRVTRFEKGFPRSYSKGPSR